MATIDTTNKNSNSNKGNKKRGWDDIESIFDQKKKQQRQQKTDAASEQQQQQQQQRRLTKRETPRQASSSHAGAHNNNNSHSNNNHATKEWVDDGLGGIYNQEGYTGRVSQDGMKIYKAHVISKNIQHAGQTKDCPFDCQCCFI